jgi:hypothetical protein
MNRLRGRIPAAVPVSELVAEVISSDSAHTILQGSGKIDIVGLLGVLGDKNARSLRVALGETKQIPKPRERRLRIRWCKRRCRQNVS